MPLPIQQSAAALDLSPRVQTTKTVVGSPAANAETIIASLTLAGDLAVVSGIEVLGWAAYTVGTSGTATTLRLRQTNASGTVVATTGALTGGIAAAALVAQDIDGFDAAPTMPGQVYVMTLQVTAGAAISTVSAVYLRAMIV